ncbi:MAG TPA: septum formation initiator family protein [Deltaproteobacteria bacterium]|jgi:cell division protein FtsB|nr:septum formation initiator family protein [Pseudomonadota bacterium]HNU74283.1 septum formation initiator family protein [Deltaproteobacteria bacterium]HRR21060.1 septum formation initiator family protein [Desulfomonilia bacterium]HON61120.1 septum formation initiator family protein [Deltaproteobacteria bacterium]HPA84349.1 septum formation initiator family protein [Deltaproteobacteria bacterium]
MRISRPVVYALILTTVLFLFFTVPGDKGLIRSYQLYQELKNLQEQNVSLKKKNEGLAREASMLKENLAYIEHVIIQEMNLVKPGDRIVVFKKAKK